MKSINPFLLLNPNLSPKTKRALFKASMSKPEIPDAVRQVAGSIGEIADRGKGMTPEVTVGGKDPVNPRTLMANLFRVRLDKESPDYCLSAYPYFGMPPKSVLTASKSLNAVLLNSQNLKKMNHPSLRMTPQTAQEIVGKDGFVVGFHHDDPNKPMFLKGTFRRPLRIEKENRQKENEKKQSNPSPDDFLVLDLGSQPARSTEPKSLAGSPMVTSEGEVVGLGGTGWVKRKATKLEKLISFFNLPRTLNKTSYQWTAFELEKPEDLRDFVSKHS